VFDGNDVDVDEGDDDVGVDDDLNPSIW
jgi:hypothetical protein